MTWKHLSATLSKSESDPNEDAMCLSADLLSIADGASSGFDSGRWSRTLVENARVLVECLASPIPSDPCEPPTKASRHQRFRVLSRRFAELQTRASTSPSPSEPWYVSEARRRGGASTFAVARYWEETGMLDVWAIGDTCWFIVREGVIQRSFPIEDAGKFPIQPRLLRSMPSNRSSWSRIGDLLRSFPPKNSSSPSGKKLGFFLRVDFKPAHDRLVGATDAVAQWLLHENVDVRKGRMTELIQSIERGPASFQELIEAQRECGAMKRDDSTALVATWEPKAQSDVSTLEAEP